MARRPLLTGSAVVPLPRRYWDIVKASVPPMHEAGRPFVAGALTFGLFGWQHGWSRRASLVAAAGLALCFREPPRVPPTLAGAVVAPVDGVVVAVDEYVPPAELGLGEAPLPRVTIATPLTGPYVHRVPVSGEVAHLEADGSALVLRTAEDATIGLLHTPSTALGRIVWDVYEGDEVVLGQTYALIRFGSRVEVLLPAGSTVLPLLGQHAVGGETVLTVLRG